MEQCRECKNQPICKFTNDCVELNNKVNELNEKMDADMPIKIMVKCNFFQSSHVNGTYICNSK